jgi:RNA polymerase sigma factor (sigma-70 family)
VSAAETSDKIDAARVLEAKQRLNLLKGVLERMDPQRRDALLMLKLEELTYVQIAQRMGVSQTWAKKLARDALIECDRFIRHAEGE